MNNQHHSRSKCRSLSIIFLLFITFPLHAEGYGKMSGIPAILFSLGLTLLMHFLLIGTAVWRFSGKRSFSVPLNFSAFGVFVFSFLSRDVIGDVDTAFKWNVYSNSMIVAAMILVVLNYTIHLDKSKE